MKPQSIAILGAGNMGTALAKVIAENGHAVKLWNYEGDAEPLEQIEKYNENKKYLPGIILPKNIFPVFDLEEALEKVDMVFFVVSSMAMEAVVQRASEYIPRGIIAVDLSKGLDPKNGELMTSSMEKFLRKKKIIIASLTGPAIAHQIAEKQPTALVIATRSKAAGEKVKKVLVNDYLRMRYDADIIGAEVLQSFKNVYGIGMGMAGGIPLTLNAQSFLFTLAMEELSLINKAFGGKKESAYGLMGLGDFLTTAFSVEGRNRQFGEWLGRGLTPAEAKEKVQQTVEGVPALEALKKIAKKKKLKLPFAFGIAEVLSGKKTAVKMVEQLFATVK